MQLVPISACRCLYRVLPVLCADSHDEMAARLNRPTQLEYG